MKVMIGIPVLDNVSWRFFLHTCVFVAKIARKYDVAFSVVNRCAIDRARQIVVETAIREKADRLLFIDDDTLVAFDTIEKLNPLLEADNVVSASGICYQRGYPFMPMVYKFNNFDFEDATKANQLVPPFPKKPFEVSATGMGICLLNVKNLKKLGETAFGRDGPGTEDFYFYRKASKAGLRSMVHPEVHGGHIAEPGIIDHTNVDMLRGFALAEFLPDEDGGRGFKKEVSV